ncbi:MAG: hypothetical protein ABJN11_10410 [Lentilitoribacter sp.]
MEIKKKKIQFGDLDEQIELSKTEYPDDHFITTDKNHLSWKLLEAPYGAIDATLMFDKDQMVGRSFRQQRPFLVSHEAPPIQGATIFDVLIAEKSRNALATLNLIKQGSDLSDVDLILHGSNEFSHPLYSKLLRYPVAFSLTLKALPLRIANPLKKLVGFGPSFLDVLASPLHLLILLCFKLFSIFTNIQLSDDEISQENQEIIHLEFRSIAGPHFQRDNKFFKWRYKTGPIFNAKIVGIYKKRELLGYAALKQASFEGVKLGLVIDLQIRRELSYAERKAVTFGLVAQLVKNKTDAVAVLANFENKLLSRMFGFPFISIPDRFLPHENPIFVLTEIKDGNPLDGLRNTYYTLADLDYF